MLLFLPGSARLRPETPDLTIRLVLQDRVLTATTRRTLSDTALDLPDGPGRDRSCASCCARPPAQTSDVATSRWLAIAVGLYAPADLGRPAPTSDGLPLGSSPLRACARRRAGGRGSRVRLSRAGGLRAVRGHGRVAERNACPSSRRVEVARTHREGQTGRPASLTVGRSATCTWWPRAVRCGVARGGCEGPSGSSERADAGTPRPEGR